MKKLKKERELTFSGSRSLRTRSLDRRRLDMVINSLTKPFELVEFLWVLEASILDTKVMNDLVSRQREFLERRVVDKFSEPIKRKLEKALLKSKIRKI